ALWGRLEALPREAAPSSVADVVFRAEEAETWEAEAEADDLFVVRGRGPERVVAMTDLENDSAVRRMHRILERMGVIRRLRELGARDGATVRIGEAEFDFID